MTGDLRHRVTIQRLETTKDSLGGAVETWVDFKTCWAKVQPVSGREYWEAKKANAEVSIRVTMRYTPGILPNMRLFHAGRFLEIVVVRNIDERNRETVLLCKELAL